MAYMDNAYRLVMGLLKSRMVPLAVIESATGQHASDIEAVVARVQRTNLTPAVRAGILAEISRRIPISVEDAFLNADKLRQKFPTAFADIAIDDAGKVAPVGDMPSHAVKDFLAASHGVIVNTEVMVKRIDDKVQAIQDAHAEATMLRLQTGNNIDKLLSGSNVSSMTWNQKTLFLWISCYAKAARLDMRDAFLDVFNYLGADDRALIGQVEFSEQFIQNRGLLNFNEFVISSCGQRFRARTRVCV